MEKKTDFIASEMGWGAQLHETALGPQALQKHLNLNYESIIKPLTSFQDKGNLSYPERVKEIAEFSKRLSQAAFKSITDNHFPIALGGDDTTAIGMWSGITFALKARQRFGLIWIDAHMDSHTIKTTPSEAIHGMPLAALLGFGEQELTTICESVPKLNPSHVVLIGTRSYESGEAELLKKLNVKIYFMEEVERRGFLTVLTEAVSLVSKNTFGFGVNLDLDVFDPSIAPGVGSPEKGGIESIAEITNAFQFLKKQPKLKALTVAEYNPTRDRDNRTADLVNTILTPWFPKS